MKRNNILQIDGEHIKSRGNEQTPGPANINKREKVPSSHLEFLIHQLEGLKQQWEAINLIDGALISVQYNRIVPKSKRLSHLFKVRSSDNPGKSIVGVCFGRGDKHIYHIITHYIPLSVLSNDIANMRVAKDYIDNVCGGVIGKEEIDKLNKKEAGFKYKGLPKSAIAGIIVDSNYISNFFIKEDQSDITSDDAYIVTIYKTNSSNNDIFQKIGLNLEDVSKLDENTYLLKREQVEIVRREAPYLISMQVKDLSAVTPSSISERSTFTPMQIPSPGKEPVVGVIDTPCSKDVYFREWVECVNLIDENIPIQPSDYEHGTAVSSIIVDGPSFNPSLEDDCGRFKVKHFAVTTGGRFNSSAIIKNVRKIVAENPHIKVWNFSLGSEIEVSDIFISPAAAELDKIQVEFDVIFVVAGTNKTKNASLGSMRVGAPADSLNAVVVNSVTNRNAPASYSRSGPVLSFFHKPDVSYYGGDEGQLLTLCSHFGERHSSGTSYAAPWITRKLAYMIYKMHLSKEVAKALLIDSAAGWHCDDSSIDLLGYGVVPKSIKSILTSESNEIRFIISRTAEEYETYTYNIPIPMSDDKFPFYARATLCYFPNCIRSQGVDYTSTELDIRFGRVKTDESKHSEILHISKSKGNKSASPFLNEEEARKMYRKWDNVKYVCEEIKTRRSPRRSYGSSCWGLSVKMKERLKLANSERRMPFAVVITMCEMNGKNRCPDFIQYCRFLGWNVQEIDIDTQNDIFLHEQEDLVLHP